MASRYFERIDHGKLPRAVLEGLLLFALTLAVHALVLRWIFPGYYAPLWPFHSDFYAPADMAAQVSFHAALAYPRPIGALYLVLIGHCPIAVQIATIAMIALLNCVLTAMFFRRIAKMSFDWKFITAYVLYVFLLVAHPYFYVHYTFDTFSQLEYLSLIAAAWCFASYCDSRSLVLLAVCSALVLLGFLAKETYAASALFLSAAWLLMKRKSDLRLAVVPFAIVCTTAVLALIIESILHSPFTGGENYQGAPYQITFSPIQILTEWARYAHAGMNLVTVAALLLIIYAVFRRKAADLQLLGLMMGAGVLAWLPNAALPNHYFADYSWNGVYLLFAAILMIPLLWEGGRSARVSALLVALLVLLSPLASRSMYGRNAWTLASESKQRNYLQSLAALDKSNPAGAGIKRVLVTGINFPFSPFVHGYSLLDFPHLSGIQFDVIDYGNFQVPVSATRGTTAGSNGVRFIVPAGVDFSRYQSVWAFDSDGSLAEDMTDVANIQSGPGNGSAFSYAELLLYPDLFKIFQIASNDGKRTEPDAGQYLQCGMALIGYRDLDSAASCLKSGLKLDPTNPYLYFYLGKVEEQKGALDSAREMLQQAIAHDNKKSPNPFFAEELSKLGVSQPAE